MAERLRLERRAWPEKPPDPTLITVTLPEFVRVSGLSKSTAYRLVKAKQLQSVQIGGRRLIVMASYVALVNRQLDGGINGGTNESRIYNAL